MNSSIKLNPHDFEYLTRGDQEYLAYIQRLYLLNGGRLEHFRVLGPWHQVDSQQLKKIIYRVASPPPRPCSRGHVKGLWCIEDRDFMSGPVILKRHINPGSWSSTPRTHRTESQQPKVSIPRKYQVIPKPTPWIIMEPSKKKNFVTDDPPDPSYREVPPRPPSSRVSSSRASSARASSSRAPSARVSSARAPSARASGSRVYSARVYSARASSPRKPRGGTATDRSYVGSSRQSVTSEEMGDIVNRVSRPTVASRGGIDLEEKFRNKDYVYGSRPCTPNLDHICQPTVASRGGVDLEEKFANKDYVYGSGIATPDVLHEIVNRITKPTVASTGGAGMERDYTDFVYGEQPVNHEQMADIVGRVTKPTVASRGGVDLENKDFIYIPEKKVKTNIIIPGLETRYMGKKKVSAEVMGEITERLNKLTPAYTAKYSINPHVWVDTSARTGPAHQREMAVS